MAVIRGFDVEIEGLRELESQFAGIGKIPKRYLTKASKTAIRPILSDAKANAPVGETGMLQKSLQIKQETPNKRNKAVYRLAYNPKYTDHFLKPTTGVYGGRTPFAYYPASVEYGYKTKFGRVEGQYAMSYVVHKNEAKSSQILVDELEKAIDDIIESRRNG